MGNLFGIDLDMPEPWPAAAHQLFRQAAPRRPPLAAQSRRVTRGSGVAKRSSADYLRLAQALLGHPDWIAAAGLSKRARQRVQARLIDAALALVRHQFELPSLDALGRLAASVHAKVNAAQWRRIGDSVSEEQRSALEALLRADPSTQESSSSSTRRNLRKMKTFGELTQIELDETIAKNEYESRLIRAIRARTTGADPQALIKDLIPPDELARIIEEAKESLK